LFAALHWHWHGLHFVGLRVHHRVVPLTHVFSTYHMIPPCNLASTTWKEFTGFFSQHATQDECCGFDCSLHEHDERLEGSPAPGLSSRYSVLGGQAHLGKGELTTTPPSPSNVYWCHLQHGPSRFVSPETMHFHRTGYGVLCSGSAFWDGSVHKTPYAHAHALSYAHARSCGFDSNLFRHGEYGRSSTRRVGMRDATTEGTPAR
jgi:hypothetical protein